jgi:hypothetical protein
MELPSSMVCDLTFEITAKVPMLVLAFSPILKVCTAGTDDVVDVSAESSPSVGVAISVTVTVTVAVGAEEAAEVAPHPESAETVATASAAMIVDLCIVTPCELAVGPRRRRHHNCDRIWLHFRPSMLISPLISYFEAEVHQSVSDRP